MVAKEGLSEGDFSPAGREVHRFELAAPMRKIAFGSSGPTSSDSDVLFAAFGNVARMLKDGQGFYATHEACEKLVGKAIDLLRMVL